MRTIASSVPMPMYMPTSLAWRLSPQRFPQGGAHKPGLRCPATG
jgi:hypothetical protein